MPTFSGRFGGYGHGGIGLILIIPLCCFSWDGFDLTGEISNATSVDFATSAPGRQHRVVNGGGGTGMLYFGAGLPPPISAAST